MTKQQFIKHDPVKAKRKEILYAVAFAAFVVVPLVWYITEQLAK